MRVRPNVEVLRLSFAGLMELGPEVSKVFIFPRVKSIAERIDNISETPHPPPAPDKIAANHIKLLLLVRKLISIGLCDN